MDSRGVTERRAEPEASLPSLHPQADGRNPGLHLKKTRKSNQQLRVIDGKQLFNLLVEQQQKAKRLEQAGKTQTQRPANEGSYTGLPETATDRADSRNFQNLKDGCASL